MRVRVSVSLIALDFRATHLASGLDFVFEILMTNAQSLIMLSNHF